MSICHVCPLKGQSACSCKIRGAQVPCTVEEYQKEAEQSNKTKAVLEEQRNADLQSSLPMG